MSLDTLKKSLWLATVNRNNKEQAYKYAGQAYASAKARIGSNSNMNAILELSRLQAAMNTAKAEYMSAEGQVKSATANLNNYTRKSGSGSGSSPGSNTVGVNIKPKRSNPKPSTKSNGGQGGGTGHSAWMSQAQAALAAANKNGGELTKEEIYAAFDKNKDGIISAKESGGVRFIDKDGSGATIGGIRVANAHEATRFGSEFKAANVDGKDGLSAAEVLAYYDKNKDGIISANEARGAQKFDSDGSQKTIAGVEIGKKFDDKTIAAARKLVGTKPVATRPEEPTSTGVLGTKEIKNPVLPSSKTKDIDQLNKDKQNLIRAISDPTMSNAQKGQLQSLISLIDRNIASINSTGKPSSEWTSVQKKAGAATSSSGSPDKAPAIVAVKPDVGLKPEKPAGANIKVPGYGVGNTPDPNVIKRPDIGLMPEKKPANIKALPIKPNKVSFGGGLPANSNGTIPPAITVFKPGSATGTGNFAPKTAPNTVFGKD